MPNAVRCRTLDDRADRATDSLWADARKIPRDLAPRIGDCGDGAFDPASIFSYASFRSALRICVRRAYRKRGRSDLRFRHFEG